MKPAMQTIQTTIATQMKLEAKKSLRKSSTTMKSVQKINTMMTSTMARKKKCQAARQMQIIVKFKLLLTRVRLRKIKQLKTPKRAKK